MKDRTLLLAGLVEEDDLEETRHIVVESYESQIEDDLKNVSEQVSFVEEDEFRLLRLIGEEEEIPEWEGKTLNEGAMALGGFGQGFSNQQGYGVPSVSSRYTPSTQEVYGAILGKDFGNQSKWSEVKNPKVELFRKIGNMNSSAFSGNGATPVLGETELPEFDENFNPILGETEFLEGDYPISEDENKLYNGEFAVMGGIGPGFSAYGGPKEIKNPYANVQVMDKWYISEDKEQLELPGELADLDMDSLDEPEESAVMPQTVNLTNMNLNLKGERNGQYVYSSDDGDVTVGISKDVDGWYAQVRDSIMGLAGEGSGESPVAAMTDSLKSYTGSEQEMPSSLMKMDSLNESLEGRTQGDAWYYKRTGTPGNGNINFRENGVPTMHPESPEEPSSEGHPGLPGWQFYEGDHTYQKMHAKMDDVLDEGESIATEEVMKKFFSKYSVYQEGTEDSEEDEIIFETEDEMKTMPNMEQSRGMTGMFSIE